MFIFLIAASLGTAILLTTLHFLSRNKERADGAYYKKEGRLFKRLIKDSWYTLADEMLKEAGYPFSTKFFLLMILVILSFGCYTSIEGLMSGEISHIPGNLARLFIFSFVPLYLFLSQKIRSRQNKIRLELTNISDIMYFQTQIGTPNDVILAYVARVAKPPLREPLQYIANAPKVKKSYEEALENLRRLSRITEIQAFSFILAQKEEMGISEKSYKTQSNLLKRNKRIRRKIIRQYKRTKLIIAAFLLFVCYILLVSVPLLQEVMQNLDLMFR